MTPAQPLQHVDVEGLISHDLFETGVLLLELTQPLGVVGLHAADLAAHELPGRLGDLESACHLVDRLSLAEELVALSQLLDDLLRHMPRSLPRVLSSFHT